MLFFEPKRVYRAAKGEVPEGDYTVPLGKANVMKQGEHVTVIAWGAMLYEALDAAQKVAAEEAPQNHQKTLAQPAPVHSHGPTAEYPLSPDT